MNINTSIKFIDEFWETEIQPTLFDYIKIPCISPFFNPDWRGEGYLEAAMQLLSLWCQRHAIPGMFLEIKRLENRTPLLCIEIPGTTLETVLLYGHMDKQPALKAWGEGLGPWTPVIKGGYLYGRGSADDGYAIFAYLAAIKLLHHQHIPHPRCIILIEASEESGSNDLPFYFDLLSDRIGIPNVIICLDSTCGNYNQMWITNSLRGVIDGELHIEILKKEIHSGMSGGIVPTCFMILRQLLDRVEDKNTGNILIKELQTEVPFPRLQQIKKTAAILSKEVYSSLPFLDGVQPLSQNPEELLLNRGWRSSLAITGAAGLPSLYGGNVALSSLSLKLTLRIPPTCDADLASHTLKQVLEKNPPFHAKIIFDIQNCNEGWNAPIEAPWFADILNKVSHNYFNKNVMYHAEGVSIPFMHMLGKKFPDSQFCVTGVLGPKSNAHGINECLHIPTAKKLICCIAEVIEFSSHSYGL